MSGIEDFVVEVLGVETVAVCAGVTLEVTGAPTSLAVEHPTTMHVILGNTNGANFSGR